MFTNVYLEPEHEHKGSTWAARIQKQIFVLAADEKKIVNPVIFNLLSEALLGQECIGKKGYACRIDCPLISLATVFHHVLVKVNYCVGRFSEAA